MVVTLALRSEGTCTVVLGDVFRPLLDREKKKRKNCPHRVHLAYFCVLTRYRTEGGGGRAR